MPRTRPISSPCRASQRPCAPRAAVTLGASETTRVRADCASPRIDVSDPAARPNDSAACAKGSGFHRHTSLQVTIGSLPSYKRARPAASPRPGPGGRQRLSPTRHRLVIGLMNRRQGAHATADAPIAATHRRARSLQRRHRRLHPPRTHRTGHRRGGHARPRHIHAIEVSAHRVQRRRQHPQITPHQVKIHHQQHPSQPNDTNQPTPPAPGKTRQIRT